MIHGLTKIVGNYVNLPIHPSSPKYMVPNLLIENGIKLEKYTF